MSDDARCVCGAPVSIAPCEGCGHPLKIQGRVFGVCARPDCVGEIHVSRNPARYKDALPPAVAEVLRTGELQMALYDLECATEELNRPQAEWRWDELRRVGIATERLRALRAALAVLHNGAG